MTIAAAGLDTRLKELYWEYFYIKKLLAPQKKSGKRRNWGKKATGQKPENG